MKNELEFVESSLKIKIKILKTGWKHICLKHPDLQGNFKILKECIESSEIVRRSKQDKQVYLYYKKVNGKYICAVCKHYNGDGFLITAYYSYRLQGKKILWQKK